MLVRPEIKCARGRIETLGQEAVTIFDQTRLVCLRSRMHPWRNYYRSYLNICICSAERYSQAEIDRARHLRRHVGPLNLRYSTNRAKPLTGSRSVCNWFSIACGSP
jgi:hypothetical protein